MGTLIGIGNVVGIGGQVGFAPESLTLFAAMTVPPSAARKASINALIVALKAAGAWSKFDRLYVLAAHDAQAAKLDWKNPGTDSLVSSGSVYFKKDRGFIGTGTNGKVDNTVNFNALTNYQLNDAHFSAWVTKADHPSYVTGQTTNSFGTFIEVGVFPTNLMYATFGLNSTNTAGAAAFEGNTWPTPPGTYDSRFGLMGWFMGNRKDSANIHGFWNGVTLGSEAKVSTTVPADTIGLIRSTKTELAMASVGSQLETEAADVYAALLVYMRAVGVAPPEYSVPWTYDFTTNPSLQSPEGFVPKTFYKPTAIYDWEGIVRMTKRFEATFAWYRRVENLFTDSDTFATQTVTVVSGKKYVISFTGTGTITWSGAAAGSLVGQGASSRVASATITAATTSLVCTLSGGAGSVVFAQCEDVTTQANTNPSEYVSNGTLVYPYHGAGVDGVKHFVTQNGNTVASELVTEATGANISTTKMGLEAWPPSTNKCLQSENFGTTWAAVGTPTRSAAAATCGIVVLDLIGDDDALALEGYTQNIAFTDSPDFGNVKAISLFIKQGTSTSSVVRLRDTTALADRLLAEITWSGGIPSVAMTTGTLDEVEALANGFFRVCMRSIVVTVANTNQLQIYPATDAATLGITSTGDIYLGGTDCEDYVFATPYIPTTTAAVSRTGDIAFDSPNFFDAPYMKTTPSWINSTEGTLVCEGSLVRRWGTGVWPTTNQQYEYRLIDLTTGENNRLLAIHYDVTPFSLQGYILVGGVQQFGQGPNVSGVAIHKTAMRYKVNGHGFCVDGGTVYEDTSASTPPNLNGFFLNGMGVTGLTCFRTRKFEYHGPGKTNADLQTLSAYP